MNTKPHARSLLNGYHSIAKTHGLAWVAAINNTMRQRQGFTFFRDTIAVRPNGEALPVSSFQSSLGDLPPSPEKLACTALVVV